MIGQSQVTEPLMTALRGDRVGHAYLFSGPARLRQDDVGAHSRALPQLRQGPDRHPVRRVRQLRRARSRRRRVARRRRDRRREPQRRRRCARPARARDLRPGPRPVQDLHPRRGAHGDAAGLQRPAQARRRAARSRQVHLRHDRAREGHRHDPLAHAPLPVPARPARRHARVRRSSCATTEGVTVEPGVLPLVVRAGRRLAPRHAVAARSAHRRLRPFDDSGP